MLYSSHDQHDLAIAVGRVCPDAQVVHDAAAGVHRIWQAWSTMVCISMIAGLAADVSIRRALAEYAVDHSRRPGRRSRK
jgi:hypothetical protein